MTQAKLNYRFTNQKFSYFTSDWFFLRDPLTAERPWYLERLVELREQVARQDDTIEVSHLRVETIRDNVQVSDNQITLDDGHLLN